MPFISKDWRSPGEQWVKIGPGWERAKVISYLNSGYFQNGDRVRDESIQPQYNVTTRTTREIRRQNTLSEALLQLDFYSACHDIRKFNYTCRMIQLLLYNMNYLPGNVQRILIKLVEEMAACARENGWKGEAHHVLQAIRDNMQNQPVWGGQLGSAKLWEEHKSNLQKILSSSLDENYASCNKVPPIEAFPEEVIRQVLLKLGNDKDIESLMNTSPLLSQISNENRVWRELCKYHFTPQQIDLIHQNLLKHKERNGANKRSHNKNWNSVHHLHNNKGSRGGSESPPSGRNREGSTGSSDESSSCECDNKCSSGEEECHRPPSVRAYQTNNGNNNEGCDENFNSSGYPHWKLKFKTLKRRYGLSKEEYADELNLCKSCGLLFWTAANSPPLHDCGIPILIPVKPGDFIKYFCV